MILITSASDRLAQKSGLLYSNPNSADGWPIRSTVYWPKITLSNRRYFEMNNYNTVNMLSFLRFSVVNLTKC